MTQKKKDFTASTAAALGEQRSVVAKIVAPAAAPATAPTSTPAAPTAPRRAPEDFMAGLPKRQLLYTNYGGTEVRVTFMLTQRQYEQIRRICFAQNTKQKHVFQTAVQDFIDKYEKDNGKLL